MYVHGTYVYLLAYNVMVRNHAFFEDRGNVAVFFDRPASAMAGSTTLSTSCSLTATGQKSGWAAICRREHLHHSGQIGIKHDKSI